MANSSLERMLLVLDLYTEERYHWTPDEMIRALDLPRSTLYRYLKALTKAGLLAGLPTGSYAIGTKVLALDYVARVSDPLIRRGRPLMIELSRRFPGVVTLVRRYKDQFVGIHREAAAASLGDRALPGKSLPLVRGANGRVIMAFLSRQQMATFVRENIDQLISTNLGETEQVILQNLRAIRRQGYALVHGDVRPGEYSIAAPLLDADGVVVGSISLSIAESLVADRDLKSIADHVRYAALMIGAAATGKHDRMSAAIAERVA
jgi:DNA-binding IclR family transcriptional regulator